ncbi:MAG: zinc ribbon domain-containing protein [Vicinamibacterales bacterium]
MHPDLERLVKLQALDTDLQQLKRTVETEEERRHAIDDSVEARKNAVAAIRTRLADNQHTRREIEKELAQVQGRLSKYRDQLMAVKTNKEYHAMQSEIATAESEVRKFEDRILEAMVDADEITAELKAAEQALSTAQSDATAALKQLGAETAAARQRMAQRSDERVALTREMPRNTVEMFETIASRRGAAMAEIRDGHCSVCHVRLRPKVVQDVRQDTTILQCDSCQRILYLLPNAPQSPASEPAGP